MCVGARPKANAQRFDDELTAYINDEASVETVSMNKIEDQLIGEIMDALGPLGRTFCECLYPSRDSAHLAAWDAAMISGASDA